MMMLWKFRCILNNLIMEKEKHPRYPDHHQSGSSPSYIREVVFGMEDGMVSTFGAVTGIAAATVDPSMVVLSGLVIISVESISMGVGSFLSNKSQQDIKYNLLDEEREELEKFPQEEEKELQRIYERDGWSSSLAGKMAAEAAGKKQLFFSEMAHHELQIIPTGLQSPGQNGLVMFGSYVLGGSIPLLAYFFLPVYQAILVSAVLTVSGLFLLGARVARYSKRSWWKSGWEMMSLASLAGLVGYGVGQIVEKWVK